MLHHYAPTDKLHFISYATSCEQPVFSAYTRHPVIIDYGPCILEGERNKMKRMQTPNGGIGSITNELSGLCICSGVALHPDSTVLRAGADIL